MIEQIRGDIIHKSPTFCVVDCHGIGIGIFISVNTYQKLGQEGSTTEMLTHLYVRDDALQLYGFGDPEEREMFRHLISVSGIGPRLALSILSGMTVPQLIQAISLEDYQILTKIPGVGKKTAQRLILELKEKVKISEEIMPSAVSFPISPEVKDRVNDALLALTTLGYKHLDARRAIERVLQNNKSDLALDELIKLTLQEL